MGKRGRKPSPNPPKPKLSRVLPHVYKQFRSAVARLGSQRIAIDSPPDTLWMAPTALGAPLYRAAHGGQSVAVYKVRALDLRTQVFECTYWIGARTQATGPPLYVDLGTESGARNWFELLAPRLAAVINNDA